MTSYALNQDVLKSCPVLSGVRAGSTQPSFGCVVSVPFILKPKNW